MNDSEKIENAGEKTGKSSATPQAPEDDDFEPTAEMMIHEFDDETTLNEDEEEANEDELADLEKEGEMPLEELLKLYYGGGQGGGDLDPEKGEDNDAEEGDSSDDDSKEGDTPRRTLRSTSAILNPTASGSDSDNEEKNLLRDDERKKPRIGDEYQAAHIPDLKQDCLEKDKRDDLQVWSPTKLPENAVEEYLKGIAMAGSNITKEDAEAVTFIQDNEDALFLLTQCDNDPEEALRQFKSRPPPLNNEIQVWSEEECQQFEDGLAVYGKDFFLIHMNKVRTRSVRDIVKFYYIWKKSERYDQFAAKTRLGKKKELLPANVTDYMERLLDETDKACATSIMNHNSGNYLRYCAHSVALMEHLKRLEEARYSEQDSEERNVLENYDTDAPTGNDVQGSSTSVASNPHHMLNVNSSNNNNSETSSQDYKQVIADIIENSSGVG